MSMYKMYNVLKHCFNLIVCAAYRRKKKTDNVENSGGF